MQKRYRYQNKPFQVSEWNEYSKSTQLFYQHTPIDTAIYKYLLCYNYKTKYTCEDVN